LAVTNYEFMDKSKKQVERCWKKLNTKDNTNFPIPSIRYDLRGRVAGQASSTGYIRLNLDFVRDNSQDMLEQTVPHEVVHSFLYAKKDPSHVRNYEQAVYARMAGRRAPRRDPHGETFMRYLAFLGCEQKRTHNYELQGVVKGWKYKCPKCGKEFFLSTRKHNQIRRGNRRWHTACGPDYPLARV
jgi:SprT protein